MRAAPFVSAGALALAIGFGGPAAALEGDGISVSPASQSVWSRWQGRVAVINATPGWRPLLDAQGTDAQPRGLSVLGDYYFRPSAGASPASGFRATSGVLIGARSSLSLASGTANGLKTRAAFDGRGTTALAVLPGVDNGADSATVPYVGVGYTGASAKGGWGFSADLGLMALSPGSAVKLGRVFSGTQNLDDMLRDLRLSPVLQLGVSYSF